jgi:hypothetical protein
LYYTENWVQLICRRKDKIIFTKKERKVLCLLKLLFEESKQNNILLIVENIEQLFESNPKLETFAQEIEKINSEKIIVQSDNDHIKKIHDYETFLKYHLNQNPNITNLHHEKKFLFGNVDFYFGSTMNELIL